MKKINTKGSTLLEIIVAVAIFMFVTSNVIVLYLASLNSNMKDVDRFKADMYLQQGFEAVRSIKDNNFSLLANGTYGLANSGSAWSFSGSSDIQGKYTRVITIADVERDVSCVIVPSGGTVDPSSKLITTAVSWTASEQTRSVSTSQYLTNWENPSFCGLLSDNFEVDGTAANLQNTGKQLEGITITNIGLADIIIDKMTLTWTNANNIEALQIDNSAVWESAGVGTPNGVQSSGTELNIEDFTLGQALTKDINTIIFDNDMTGALFTITFTMSDGSTFTTPGIQM